MVVEDEPMLLMAAVDAIKDTGFAILAASNADDAIRLLEADPQIRLVFTDIEMAGTMDGLKLAAYVHDRWPPVEIIVTSGRMLVEDIKLPARGIFMPKPYRPEELTTQISCLIG
ncbi:response regulator [Novosphingobium rosa]|uniref:response regulator n=1 Tax=Novosphingobium rosa TaxID=76978 RepID=UPI001FE1633A|nr:response regulator [Novosphingobium rosa]